MKYFSQAGEFDPKSKQQINKAQVYKNFNLKQAVEIFLKENPWAFEFKKGEKYLDIHF